MKLYKINRITAWILTLLIVTYIVTGFSMTGRFNVDRIIPVSLANKIHVNNLILYPTIITLFLHAGISVYPRLKNWLRK